MEKKKHPYAHIKGWGIDADLKNDPTYPIKFRTNEEHKGYTWERPEQQETDIEVLHSNERPNVTAVFGTSVPPSGLSGMIRRLAFRYGEGSYAHWLPLILADRVNMIEGVVEDLRNGHVPNLIEEKGLKAEWKHNRRQFTVRTLTKVAIATAVVAFLCTRRRRKEE